MIENPKVGQRVWILQLPWPRFAVVEATVHKLTPSGVELTNGKWRSDQEIHAAPQSAAAALREQAAELIRKADELEASE